MYFVAKCIGSRTQQPGSGLTPCPTNAGRMMAEQFLCCEVTPAGIRARRARGPEDVALRKCVNLRPHGNARTHAKSQTAPGREIRRCIDIEDGDLSTVVKAATPCEAPVVPHWDWNCQRPASGSQCRSGRRRSEAKSGSTQVCVSKCVMGVFFNAANASRRPNPCIKDARR